MRRIVILLTAALLEFVLVASPASAQVVPVDPGSTAAGRPIWGTGQNLPPLTANTPYFVGPGFATEVEAYYDSGKALRQQAEIATAAFDWVKRWIANECGGNPRSCKATVVFDVDETLLRAPEFSTDEFRIYKFKVREGRKRRTPEAHETSAWTDLHRQRNR